MFPLNGSVRIGDSRPSSKANAWLHFVEAIVGAFFCTSLSAILFAAGAYHVFNQPEVGGDIGISIIICISGLFGTYVFPILTWEDVRESFIAARNFRRK